jgi:DNA-binding transcriptional MerR regulator
VTPDVEVAAVAEVVRVVRDEDAQAVDPRLSISVFARRARLSMKALRLYDRLGVLRPAEVDQGNGYRFYRESQLASARLIGLLRQVDMPLAQVASVVGASADERPRLLAAYWDDVEHRVAGQRQLVAHLQHMFAGDERNYDMYEIKERDVAEQLVLTEQRHTTVQGLQPWLEETFGRMWTTAERLGGMAGPVLVIYHGKVDEDSDGPVEVCGPINPNGQDLSQVATRTEPAHREAYTRITKAQVAFPQILSAYDAVDQWITENGKTIGDSPREVYFADFMNAGPDDEVVDIAFPLA